MNHDHLEHNGVAIGATDKFALKCSMENPYNFLGSLLIILKPNHACMHGN